MVTSQQLNPSAYRWQGEAFAEDDRHGICLLFRTLCPGTGRGVPEAGASARSPLRFEGSGRPLVTLAKLMECVDVDGADHHDLDILAQPQYDRKR